MEAELINSLSDVAVTALASALTILITACGNWLRIWIQTKLAAQRNEFLNIVARQGVQAAEQMVALASSDAKLAYATRYVMERAAEAKITVDEVHIRTLIEQSVLALGNVVSGGNG